MRRRREVCLCGIAAVVTASTCILPPQLLGPCKRMGGCCQFDSCVVMGACDDAKPPKALVPAHVPDLTRSRLAHAMDSAPLPPLPDVKVMQRYPPPTPTPALSSSDSLRPCQAARWRSLCRRLGEGALCQQHGRDESSFLCGCDPSPRELAPYGYACAPRADATIVGFPLLNCSRCERLGRRGYLPAATNKHISAHKKPSHAPIAAAPTMSPTQLLRAPQKTLLPQLLPAPPPTPLPTAPPTRSTPPTLHVPVCTDHLVEHSGTCPRGRDALPYSVRPIPPPIFDSYSRIVPLSTRTAIGAQHQDYILPTSVRSMASYWLRSSYQACARTCLKLGRCRFGTFITTGGQCWLAVRSRAFGARQDSDIAAAAALTAEAAMSASTAATAASAAAKLAAQLESWRCGTRCVSFAKIALPKKSTDNHHRVRLMTQLRTDMELSREQAKLVLGDAHWRSGGATAWFGVGTTAIPSLAQHIPCRAVAPYLRKGSLLTLCRPWRSATQVPTAAPASVHTHVPELTSAPRLTIGSFAARSTQCRPGRFSDYGKCVACPQGKYQEYWGFVRCTHCPAAQYTLQPGAVRCKLCPAPSDTAAAPGRAQCAAASRRARATTHRPEFPTNAATTAAAPVTSATAAQPPTPTSQAPPPPVQLRLALLQPSNTPGDAIGTITASLQHELCEAVRTSLTGAHEQGVCGAGSSHRIHLPGTNVPSQAPVYHVNLSSLFQSKPGGSVIITLVVTGTAGTDTQHCACDPLFSALVRTEARARGLKLVGLPLDSDSGVTAARGSGEKSRGTRTWLVVSWMKTQATQLSESQDICRQMDTQASTRLNVNSDGDSAESHHSSHVALAAPQRSDPKWNQQQEHQQQKHHQQQTPVQLSNTSLEVLLLAMISFGAAMFLHVQNNSAMIHEQEKQSTGGAANAEGTRQDSVTAQISKLASIDSYYSSFRTAGTSSAFMEEGMI